MRLIPMRLTTALVFTGLIVTATTSAAMSAGAEEGLSGMHAKVRVGGKLCFADHSHAGNSAGHNSRKSAEAAAIRNWQDFTAWEYGLAWGSYSMAAGKSMQCSGGGSWGCTIDARPCRGGR